MTNTRQNTNVWLQQWHQGLAHLATPCFACVLPCLGDCLLHAELLPLLPPGPEFKCRERPAKERVRHTICDASSFSLRAVCALCALYPHFNNPSPHILPHFMHRSLQSDQTKSRSDGRLWQQEEEKRGGRCCCCCFCRCDNGRPAQDDAACSICGHCRGHASLLPAG